MKKQAAISGAMVLIASVMPAVAFAAGSLPAVPSPAAAAGQAAAAVPGLPAASAPTAALPAMPGVSTPAAVSADHVVNHDSAALPGLDGLNEGVGPKPAIQPIRGPGGQPLQLPLPLIGTPSAAAVERRS